jgi:hypothetical protein
MVKNEVARAVIERRTGVDFGKALRDYSGPVDTVYERLQAASDKLRDWLAQALPIERSLTNLRDQARREKADAQRAVSKAKTPAEKEAANTALAAAEQKLAAAEKALQDNEDARDVAVLRSNVVPTGQVEKWAERGILTVPLELVKKLTSTKLGFEWGGEYRGSKDLMHFELRPETVLTGKQPPRHDLKDLEPPP